MDRTTMDRREQLPERLLADERTEAISSAMLGPAKLTYEEAVALEEQFCPLSATWALELWEDLVGITPSSLATVEERRRDITVKLLSSGVTNAEMVRALCERMTGRSAQVTENFAEYSFSLRFYGESVGFFAVPARELEAAVDVIKPAHLRFIIEPITWADLEGAGITWAQLGTKFASWGTLEAAAFEHEDAAAELMALSQGGGE